MVKQNLTKIFGGVFLLVALFLLASLAKAATCGEAFNGMETKAWGDGYCWAKAYKIETTNPPSATCPTTATDADGNNYSPLIIPTLNTAGKSGSFCMIGPIKRTKNLASATKENNGNIYYSFRAATNGEVNYETLSNGKIKGICPDGWYLPLAKDIEESLMSASQDNNLETGPGPKDCWKLNDFLGTLACTHGLGGYSALNLPSGYYQESSRWWGLGDGVEGVERTIWTTSIKGKDIVYYFNKPQGELMGNLNYREMTDGIMASWNVTGDYMYNPVYCIKELDITGNTPGNQDKTTWYRDADNDGYGNPKTRKQATVKPAGYVNNNLDCNDSNKSINPSAKEVCDSNNIDENCNGQKNEGCTLCYVDNDKDGYGAKNSVTKYFAGACPVKYAPNKTDCNDSNNAINPRAKENCYNGKDDNCDGKGDNGRGTCY